MADSKWVMCAISGQGEVAVWVDPDEIASAAVGGMGVQVRNMTHLIITPQGMALRKIAQEALLFGYLIAAIWAPEQQLVENLSRAWDTSPPNGVLLPSDRDRKRFGLVP